MKPATPHTLEQQAIQAAQQNNWTQAQHLADRADQTEPARKTVPLAAAALWYAEQGLPVFPLRPNTKIPHPGSRGFHDATTNRDRIRAWWTRHPESNIGIATGHQFDAIDIDGPVGQKTRALHWCYNPTCARQARMWPRPDGWKQQCGHHGIFNRVDADTIAKVLTPRPGGLHLWVPATGDKNFAKRLPGIDYRGAGGYVVAPPSIIPEGRYTFIGEPHIPVGGQ